jgi:hypothetical protein
MTQNHPFPIEPTSEVAARAPRETLYAAKRALFERNNSALIFALCVVCLALGAVLFWTHGVYVASLERQPIYFGVDTETGAIIALRPEALRVKITDEILRHHIEGFVAKHFTRLPVITSREYKGTLLMMDSALTGQGTEVSKDLKDISDLDDNPLAHERVEVKAVNSTFEGTSNGCTPDGKPCTATVYITKTFSQSASTLRQTSSIIKLNFYILPKIKLDPDMITYNPLGLVITGMYESQGHGA